MKNRKDKRRSVYSPFLNRSLMKKLSIELGALFLIKYI